MGRIGKSGGQSGDGARWRGHGRRGRRQRGAALLLVVTSLAILTVVSTEFTYDTRINYAAAVNQRDALRAHYLARSGMALGRLLIKVQQSVVDPNRRYVGDLQVSDFAPYLMAAFAGTGASELASLLGLSDQPIKGLGIAHGSFDLAITTEDGKINLNCAGGNLAQQQMLASQLAALFAPARYNRLFEQPDVDGQFTDRIEQTRAIVDYVDRDEALYEGGGAPEDYRYQTGSDGYEARDNFFDSLAELHLVKGVDDVFFETFGSAFTVYGSCKLNLSDVQQQGWPLFASILRFAAKNPSDPLLQNEVQLAALAIHLASMRQFFGSGFADANQFIAAAKTPTPLALDEQPAQPLIGIELDPQKLGQVVAFGPRRIYRLEASAEIGKVRRRVSAVFDSQHINQNTIDPGDRRGTWVYWREE
jgi:general secretion pathway protein K